MQNASCSATKETLTISQEVTCKDTYTIYVIHCLLCEQQYVGKTVQPLMDRGRQHIQAVQALQADPQTLTPLGNYTDTLPQMVTLTLT